MARAIGSRPHSSSQRGAYSLGIVNPLQRCSGRDRGVTPSMPGLRGRRNSSPGRGVREGPGQESHRQQRSHLNAASRTLGTTPPKTALRRGRCRGRASVLQSDDEDFVALLVVGIDDEQPTPRAEHEPKPTPAAIKGVAHPRKLLERAEGTRDPLASVAGKAVREDQAVEVLDRDDAERDPSHLAPTTARPS